MSSSEDAPRQQPGACWIWLPLVYVLGLLGQFAYCLYSDATSLPHDVLMYCWDMCHLMCYICYLTL
jgi:hypothetical protein